MNPQKKAWKTRRLSSCVICKIQPRRSKKAKTCDQHCAGKLAWEPKVRLKCNYKNKRC